MPRRRAAVPRERFNAETIRLLTRLMPNARAGESGLDDAEIELAQLRLVVGWGEASETAATDISLPIAVATLVQYGRYARLHRISEAGAVTVTVDVLFGQHGRSAELFNSKIIEETERIVGEE